MRKTPTSRANKLSAIRFSRKARVSWSSDCDRDEARINSTPGGSAAWIRATHCESGPGATKSIEAPHLPQGFLSRGDVRQRQIVQCLQGARPACFEPAGQREVLLDSVDQHRKALPDA